MATHSRPWGQLLVCVFFAAIGSFLLVLHAWPASEPLLQTGGQIISRTPIYSKGNLTGFRFCVGSPTMTFTYSRPDPRVQSVWYGINNASHAKVIYSSRSRANPQLWGLTLDGQVVATPDELRSARLKGSLLWLATVLAALSYAIYLWRKSSRVPPNNSFKPNPLRGSA